MLSFYHSSILSFNHSIILSFYHFIIQAFYHSSIQAFYHFNILSFQHSLILNQLLHPIVLYSTLLRRIGTPLRPLTCVGIVATFERFAVFNMRIFEIGTDVGTDIAELTVTAHFYVVFLVILIFFEIRMIESLLK